MNKEKICLVIGTHDVTDRHKKIYSRRELRMLPWQDMLDKILPYWYGLYGRKNTSHSHSQASWCLSAVNASRLFV